MFVEIVFALLHFFFVEHAGVTELAVCESVNDRAAEVIACYIVDDGTDVSTKCCEENDEEYIKLTRSSVICGRSNN